MSESVNPLRPIELSRRTFLAAGAATLATGCSTLKTWMGMSSTMTIRTTEFGEHDGQKVYLYELIGRGGRSFAVTNYGAIVTSVKMPDRDGNLADIALGFDDLAGYVKSSPYFGCIAGRCANRIAKGKFTLDGKSYTLATNNGPNHLHGGVKGFDKQVWSASEAVDAAGVGIRLTLVSKDGDEGYPGTLTTTVVYKLTNEGNLLVDMTATTDAPTVVNLAHHTYWNLAGHSSGNVLGHELEIPASRITAGDATLIPTGELAPVAGTPYDFTKRKAMGQDIGKLKAEKDAGHGGGYDVNYCVDGADGSMKRCAYVIEPKSGRTLTILANQPGIQFYTGNFLDGTIHGKSGAVYAQHSGFCLETQKFPDSINHASFPSPILRPGETYRHTMMHEFGVA